NVIHNFLKVSGGLVYLVSCQFFEKFLLDLYLLLLKIMDLLLQFLVFLLLIVTQAAGRCFLPFLFSRNFCLLPLLNVAEFVFPVIGIVSRKIFDLGVALEN